MELVGSIPRNDFSPESDVDFLVTFEPDAEWTLFHMVEMDRELERIGGRRVDLSTQRTVERSENRIRRRSILETARPYYVEDLDDQVGGARGRLRADDAAAILGDDDIGDGDQLRPKMDVDRRGENAPEPVRPDHGVELADHGIRWGRL